MSFQVSCLIGHNGVGRSVRLVEGILSKADHVVKYFLGSMLRNTIANTARNFHISFLIGFAVNEVFLFLQHYIHLFLGHGTAHQVGTAVAVAAQVADNLHNLFLIHKAAIGNIQNGSQCIVHILDVLRIFLVFYILRNGVHRARSVK